MLTAWRRGVQFRIAIAVAALAVSAFVAPPIAVAFAPAPSTVYCLTHDDHVMVVAHEDHARIHDHSGHLDQAKHSHKEGESKKHCCGLFCVTALTPEIRGIPRPLLMEPEQTPLGYSSFHSRAPELPFRPPIFIRRSELTR